MSYVTKECTFCGYHPSNSSSEPAKLLPAYKQQLKEAIYYLETCCAYLPENDLARDIVSFIQAVKS